MCTCHYKNFGLCWHLMLIIHVNFRIVIKDEFGVVFLFEGARRRRRWKPLCCWRAWNWLKIGEFFRCKLRLMLKLLLRKYMFWVLPSLLWKSFMQRWMIKLRITKLSFDSKSCKKVAHSLVIHVSPFTDSFIFFSALPGC